MSPGLIYTGSLGKSGNNVYNANPKIVFIYNKASVYA